MKLSRSATEVRVMDVLTPEELQTVLREFQTRMKALFGDRIRDMRLYGSYAKGTAQPHSDIDILLVLEPLERSAQEKQAVSEIISDLCMAHGILVMPIFVSEEEFKTNELSFFRNVRRESVAV